MDYYETILISLRIKKRAGSKMDEFEMEGLLEEATDVFDGGFDSFFDGGGED